MQPIHPQDLLERLLADNPRIKSRSQLDVESRKSNKERRDEAEWKKELDEINKEYGLWSYG